MSNSFSVVVTGKVVDGFELGQVKANVGKLFKLTEAQIDKMFAGKPVAIRRGIDKEQAIKLRSALAKAGALATVKTSRPPAAKASEAAAAAAEPSASTAFTPDICCPRCGHEQSFTSACGLCKMDFTLQIQRLKRRAEAKAIRQKQTKSQAAG